MDGDHRKSQATVAIRSGHDAAAFLLLMAKAV
jgi:hypothetical protein